MAAKQKDATDLETYANTIYEPNDLIEIRCIGNGIESFWFTAGELLDNLPRLKEKNLDANVFIGVNPRKSQDRGDVSVKLFRTIFVDFDGVDQAYVEQLISEQGLATPSLVINSGHGVHVYWRLDEPTEDADLWRSYQRAAIAALGSDPTIKNPERIMRLPGFLNLKGKPVKCRVVRHNPDAEYAIDDLGFEPITYKPPTGTVNAEDYDAGGNKEPHPLTVRFMRVGAKQGERNGALFTAACDLAARGWTETEAAQALNKGAIGCGLEAREVSTAIKSAFSKPREAREGFDDEPLPSVFKRLAVGTESEHDIAEKSGTTFRPTLINAKRYTFEDEKGKEKVGHLYAPLDLIGKSLRQLSGGWPCMASGIMFADEKKLTDHGLPDRDCVSYFTKTSQVFAWIQNRANLYWASCNATAKIAGETQVLSTPTKEEFFEHLKQSTPEAYESLELLPHEPSIEGVYYVETKLPQSDGKALAEFLEHLNPETDEDRDLLLAAMMTCFWGGPPGLRPAFVFTSRHGRSAGKSRTAQFIARIAGGAITVGQEEDFERARQRILSEEGIATRVVLIDNLKKSFSRGSLEAAITTDRIDGHRLYSGQVGIPNLKTWFITANSPSLSRDLAQRSVVLEIGAHKSGADFESWSEDFIRNKRANLIADLLAMLRSEDQCKISKENSDRWISWARAVLQKFENGDKLARHIIDKRPTVDSDLEDAADFAEVIFSMVRKAHGSVVNVADCCCYITKTDLRNELIERDLIDKSMGIKATTSRLLNLSDVGELVHFKQCKKPIRFTTQGVQRAWCWTGPNWTASLRASKFDPTMHKHDPGGPGADEVTTQEDIPF